MEDNSTIEVSYRGYFEENWPVVQIVETVGPRQGLVSRLPLRWDLYDRSIGFAWGYCGAGPGQLAVAMLVHAIGIPDLRPTYKTDKEEVDAHRRVLRKLRRRARPPRHLDENTELLDQPGELALHRGWAVVQALSGRFDAHVTSRIPKDHPWLMPRSEVLAWMHLPEAQQEAEGLEMVRRALRRGTGGRRPDFGGMGRPYLGSAGGDSP